MPGFQTGFRTTLAAALTTTATTATLSTAPVATSGRMLIFAGNITEWISYTGVSGNTITGLTRNLSQTADPVTGGTGLAWGAGTQIIMVAMHDQIIDKESAIPIVGFTTTQRDALNMSQDYFTGTYPIIYNTTTTQYEYYNGVAWASFATGTVADATTTTGGKVKISDVMVDPVAVVTASNRYIAGAGAGGTPSATNLYETQFDTSNGSTKTATTISFVAGTKTIADSGNGFITAGFKQGTQITVTGSASNNSTFTIESVAAGAIVVAESLVTEGAGASVTITSVTADKGYRLKSTGKIDATMLEGALPALDGSALTGIGDKYAISNNILPTAWTNGAINIGNLSGGTFAGVIASIGSRRIGDAVVTPTGNGVGSVVFPITGLITGDTFTYALGKSIFVKNKFKNDSSRDAGIGFAVTATSLYAAETSTTAGTVRFLIKSGVVWACNANGSSYTATNVDSGITDANNNTYAILYTPTAIYFYINNVLVATHTTNIPVTGTPNWGLGINGNGNDPYYVGDLIYSLEN